MQRFFLLFCLLVIPSLSFANTSWTRVNGQEGQDNWVFSMDAIDPNTAWFIGSVSNNGNTEIKGFRMTNGTSFSSMTLPVGGGTMTMFTDLRFVDTQVGFITGMDISLPFKADFSTNILWRTTNGGGSWELVDDTIDEMIIRMAAFPTGELFAVSDKSFYGLSGNTLQKGGAVSIGDLSISTLHMLTPYMGYIAGGQGRNEESTQLPGRGFVFKTVDGGANWVPVVQELPFQVTAIWFINENIGYIGGDDGTNGYLRVTVDGGQTWSDQTLPLHPELTIDIELPFKFSQTIDPLPPSSISAIRFFDCERGVALGMACTGSCDTPDEASYLTIFMRTYDGGITWVMDPDYEAVMDGWGQMEMMPKVVSGMQAMSFVSPNNGLIGGQNLMVLQYTADSPEELPEPGIPSCSGSNNTNNSTTNNTNNGTGFNDGSESSGCGCAHAGQSRGFSPAVLFMLSLFLGFVALGRRYS